MSQQRLMYLPLGGAGEVGMNCYVYGYGPQDKERLIVVDLGVTFPDMDGSPGVDLIISDIAWLEARKDRIDGVFITHAHEDHVGAVGHTYARLGAPIYCRAFTANIARRKLEEHGVPANAVTVMGAWPDQVGLGPFEVGFLPISHSIPESSGLVLIRQRGGWCIRGISNWTRRPWLVKAGILSFGARLPNPESRLWSVTVPMCFL